jgi:hypothetical protein
MQTVIWVGIWALFTVFVELFSCLWFDRRGYRRGTEEGAQHGYAHGLTIGFWRGWNACKQDGGDWWTWVEREVNETRQKIASEGK